MRQRESFTRTSAVKEEIPIRKKGSKLICPTKEGIERVRKHEDLYIGGGGRVQENVPEAQQIWISHSARSRRRFNQAEKMSPLDLRGSYRSTLSGWR